MADKNTQFTVNTYRYDPYKTFQFRVMWDGKYVAGVSKVSGLTRTTEVVKQREGGAPSEVTFHPNKRATRQSRWNAA
jgi:phage tail-like protein